MEYLKSIYKYTINLIGRKEEEEQFTVEVRHGGNQFIDEFYEKKEDGRPDYNRKRRSPMTLQIGKSKTILDVKNIVKTKIHYPDGRCLNVFKNNGGDNFHLKTSVFGQNRANGCPLMRMTDKEDPENNVIKLFIVIPNW